MLLGIEPNKEKTGIVFGVEQNVPVVGANAAARREHDKRIGAGTMSRSGAQCLCCKAVIEMEDIRLEGRAGRLGTVMTAAVVDGQDGKEYRLPTEVELRAAEEAAREVPRVFADIPFGLPTEPLPSKEALGFRVPLYGIDQWHKLHTSRQLVALGTLLRAIRNATEATASFGYSQLWSQALAMFLAAALDRTANYLSTLCIWESVAEEVKQTFLRFALPITWDFGEGNPLAPNERFFIGAIANVADVLDRLLNAVTAWSSSPTVEARSATAASASTFDLVLTDPPYYDAIPYSDLMDFFYVWLRRVLAGQDAEIDRAFSMPLGPKWDAQTEDGELIDDASRFAGDGAKSKRAYEEGMFRSFRRCQEALNVDGRMVVVFANKKPDAWETLASAMIRAGFVVDGSWPIMTEMRGGVRNFGRASLASSVWLVCRKRSEAARPGWDNRVLEDMHRNITLKLREFWDTGIRGPDFVWAATGPALEAYSQHPAVKKANNPGELMTVSEFLKHVRRIVVDFVVGRVLLGDASSEEASGLDDVTSYYLLHRHDFGLKEAPAGTCILYALSCGLSDRELADQYDLLVRTGGKDEAEADDDVEEVEGEEEGSKGSGSRVKLKPWQQRKVRSLGYETAGGRAAPLIDQVHRLMHLWKSGEVVKVNEYLDARALRQNRMFHHLLQALIELAPHASEERSLLESISNHVVARGVAPQEELRL